MKFILLGIFILFFVILPMYILNSLVMPQLITLKQTYQNVGDISQQVSNNISNQ